MKIAQNLNSYGQFIWVSLFGKWIFLLLIPWFVPCMAYLMIGDPYLSSVGNFLFGSLLVLVMTAIAFIPHDWAVQYITLQYPSLNYSLKRILYTFISFCTISFFFITFYSLFIIQYKPFNSNLSSENIHLVYLFDFMAIFMLVCIYEVNYSIKKWKELKVNKESIRKANMQGQLHSLKSQVNPHFLFNSLNTLSALITYDSQKAEEFVDEMAKVYRYLLQTNQQELTTLRNEIKFAESYYHLLRTRHDEGLNLELNITEEDLDKYLPPLSLQLLLENAVKHNTILEKKPLLIEIESLEGGWLSVRNNLLEKSTPVKSTRLGLQNILAKYALLSTRKPIITNGPDYFSVLLPLLSEKPEIL
jgi:two-component system LytT family sensor kinase